MTSLARTCPVDGCERTLHCKGYCRRHYVQMSTHGKILKDVVYPTVCTIDGCERKFYGRGYCSSHYATFVPRTNKRLCEVEGCSNQHKAKGLCNYHYSSTRRLVPEVREREAKRMREWQQANPERIKAYNDYRRAYRLDLASSLFTNTDVIDLYGTDCHICLEAIDMTAPRHAGVGPGWELGLHIDHVIALVNGGAHSLENVRPSHAICNLRKNRRQ